MIKIVLKDFAKFPGKPLYRSLLFNKVLLSPIIIAIVVVVVAGSLYFGNVLHTFFSQLKSSFCG